MRSWNFLFRDKKDNYKACALFAVFFLYYLLNNLPFLAYIRNNAGDLAEHSPFYGAPFTLNLFNFDPSMYYGAGNASVIHPFINFLTGPFSVLTEYLFENYFFLILQSAINAVSVVLLFIYLRRTGSGAGAPFPLLIAVFFGIGSYNLFTAMIPDSYPYAQLAIILSVVYLAYAREQKTAAVAPNVGFALLNFGITSTNVITFFGALFFNVIETKWTRRMRSFLLIGIGFLFMTAVVTLLQWLLFGGDTWIQNWMKTLHNGGYNYTAPFSFAQHWKAIYMLGISPVLTPDLTLVSPGIVAFATDLTRPYPLYVHIIGISMLLLAVIGFIRNVKSREVWTLAVYLLFAVYLHLVKGYGLAVFQYDMYLYAGHYLFAIFLLGGRFLMQLEQGRVRKIGFCLVLLFALVTFANNVIKHAEALDVVKSGYAEQILTRK